MRSRAQWLRALAAPLHVVLLLGILLVGIVAGAPLALSVSLALVVYASAVVRKLIEDTKPDQGPKARRPADRERTSETTIALDDLAPEFRTEVEDVHRRARRIERAIKSVGLPEEGVRTELAAFVKEAERSARAAQMLQRQLSTPRRERPEAVERVESQLAGYHSEIERLCARLDAVGDDHLSDPAQTPDEIPLAAELHSLREEMGALAVGVEDAYQETRA